MTTVRRVDASMSLLNDLMRQPIDGDYAAAHAARVARPSSRPQRLTRSGLVLVVAVVLGVVLSGAVVNLRAPTAALRASRQLLVDQVSERTQQADDLAAANAAMSDQIAALQAQALESSDPQLLARLRGYELASGAIATIGPGLVFELTDAPGDGAPAEPTSLVQDVDLRVLVNGLWAAGAEAIAVNGVRLTATSPIRSVHQAVFVNLVPVTSPYTVSAIGDPQTMQTRLAQGTTSSYLALLTSAYGIAVSTKAADHLELPGAGASVLRYAELADVASSDAQDSEGVTTP
ncbi:DUF881 domain-containing protein [Isoptericola sp. b441]|uniref:DUF881 domain-containing protein n=1 Tax=Actinotalea lenta TaxID=3064654 RepID=A0ABT9DA01_9CELL|nr:MULTISPECIES: DUF881 domain-containing protein [unclassified Isoptericola]MDO8107732.1 DUF881 domain-containing protein [Isoptericola sp. b441]MDO8120597.1 DUF881 domain-containing protein [Isoptericola sp. b490]